MSPSGQEGRGLESSAEFSANRLEARSPTSSPWPWIGTADRAMARLDHHSMLSSKQASSSVFDRRPPAEGFITFLDVLAVLIGLLPTFVKTPFPADPGCFGPRDGRGRFWGTGMKSSGGGTPTVPSYEFGMRARHRWSICRDIRGPLRK